MAKFLRSAGVRGYLKTMTLVGADETPANQLKEFWDCPNWFTGAAMYFRLALPVACSHAQKLNIYGCPVTATTCEDAVLGVASVWVPVPASSADYSGNCRRQQALTLEVAHTAIECAAERFSFDRSPFVAARQQVEQNDYVLRFQIGKSRKSPNRKFTAAVWCEFETHYRTELVVTRDDGSECCRYAFATTDDSSIGQIQWQGNEQVHVPLTAISGGAHWICALDGTYSFISPNSQSSSPHHWYQHARMLLEGLWVIADPVAGLMFLKRAAAAGDKHAIRRLQFITEGRGTPASENADAP